MDDDLLQFAAFQNRHERADDVKLAVHVDDDILQGKLVLCLKEFIHQGDLLTYRNAFIDVEHFVGRNGTHQTGERFQQFLKRHVLEQILVGERKHECAFLAGDGDVAPHSTGFQELGVLLELLVFDQLLDQFLPWILIFLVKLNVHGKEHPALDGQQFRRHLVETGHRAQINILMAGEIVDELVGDLGDGDIVDVHFGLLDHVQQKFQRSVKLQRR
jgi:hypothetical protein